ncbi:MAG TPA: hypothetical protein VK892_07075 [Pyrinomonadaceae bacterium]|nr:hypothetical protein [Pyrinomonadaceae bacterium]
MKLLTVILAINFLFVSAVFAQKDFPTIKPAKTYKQSEVKIVSPNETGWQLVKSAQLENVFAKVDSDGKYNASAKTSTINAYENVNDLFENLEKLKQEEISRLNRDSLHFNRTNFKEVPCLQYDGIFNNDARKEANYKYFNLSGYLCQHPTAKNTLIQIEFSNHSNLRGFSETANKLSKEFFEKIEFSKVKNK